MRELRLSRRDACETKRRPFKYLKTYAIRVHVHMFELSLFKQTKLSLMQGAAANQGGFCCPPGLFADCWAAPDCCRPDLRATAVASTPFTMTSRVFFLVHSDRSRTLSTSRMLRLGSHRALDRNYIGAKPSDFDHGETD